MTVSETRENVPDIRCVYPYVLLTFINIIIIIELQKGYVDGQPKVNIFVLIVHCNEIKTTNKEWVLSFYILTHTHIHIVYTTYTFSKV